MSEIDTFGAYVRSRLDHWGREFMLARDMDYLGHQSKNILQVLIEHKGEMPGRMTGFKPLEVDQDAHQIELIVSDIAREQRALACVLRAYYCGTGRRKVERYETALMLVANAAGKGARLPNVKQYLGMVVAGTDEVRNVLAGMARAA